MKRVLLLLSALILLTGCGLPGDPMPPLYVESIDAGSYTLGGEPFTGGNGTAYDVFNATADGLVPMPGASTGRALIDNGTWSTIAGAPGINGTDGDDGYTPVFGVDYFNGADGDDGYTPVFGVDYFNGADGDDGVDGKTWYSGSGAPGDGTGVNGDYYLNTANQDVYIKAGGTWGSPALNIKGATGSQGIQGIQGETGTAGVNFTDKFVDIINWNSIAGWTTGSVGGSSAAQGALLYFVSGVSNTNYYGLRQTNSYQSIIATGKVITVEWIISYATSVTSATRWLYFTADTTIPPVDTSNHFGFKITNADILATNGNSVTETSTDTTDNLATGTQFTALRAVLIPGTDCKYYVNGVLRATHTTNLPANGSYYLATAVRTDAAGAKDFYISRIMIARDY